MERFVWGSVIEKTEFDGVEIVKYHPWRRKGSSILTGQVDYEKVEYQVKEIHESFFTLYHAVLGIMVYKMLGSNNSNIVYAIYRMLDIKED